jgi:hypothetical protein
VRDAHAQQLVGVGGLFHHAPLVLAEVGGGLLAVEVAHHGHQVHTLLVFGRVGQDAQAHRHVRAILTLRRRRVGRESGRGPRSGGRATGERRNTEQEGKGRE